MRTRRGATTDVEPAAPERTSATQPTVADGRLLLTTGSLLAAQRSVGNRAASVVVQRDAAVREAASAPVAPPLEFIGGSGSLGYSRGHQTTLTLRLMRQHRIGFVEASRMAADRLRGRGRGQPGRSAAMLDDPMSAVDSRQAVLFSVAGRRGRRGHLPELAPSHSNMRRLVSGMRSQYGSRLDVVHNPSAADMGDLLDGHLDVMADEVGPGNRGELVVNFQGHGGPTSIEGADRRPFTLDDLLTRAERARRANIRMVIISDACFSGAMTVVAQRQAGQELARRTAREAMANRNDPTALQLFDEVYHANLLLSALEGIGEHLQPLKGRVRRNTPTADVRPRLEATARFLELVLRHADRFGPQLAGVEADAARLHGRVTALLARLRGARVGALATELNRLWRAISVTHDEWSERVTAVHEHVDGVLAVSGSDGR